MGGFIKLRLQNLAPVKKLINSKKYKNNLKGAVVTIFI